MRRAQRQSRPLPAAGPTQSKTFCDQKTALTTENLILEKLRFLWRVVHERRFMSAQQHQFLCLKLDEIGRMVDGWLKSLDNRKS